jgi:cytochrome c-type biogenesis protein
MIEFLGNLLSTYLLGLLVPLGAVCVLPLYPGFIAFLSQRMPQKREGGGRSLVLGLIVTAGVIVFMAAIGVVFTTFLSVSLTEVIGIVSPIAFGVLAVISILLILDVDMGRLFRSMKVPQSKRPVPGAFLFGFFFGAIVLPCNPGLIAAFFTKSLLVSNLDFLSNIAHFILFAIGIATPLLVFSILSEAVSKGVIRFLVKHRLTVNRVAGVLMLGISLYYLIFVFRILSYISGKGAG